MLGSNRNQEEQSDDSEAKPRWHEAPVTQGESMITVTGGSKRPGTHRTIPKFRSAFSSDFDLKSMQKNNERKTFADKGENLKFWDKYLFERKCLTVYLQHFNEEKSKNSPKRQHLTIFWQKTITKFSYKTERLIFFFFVHISFF